MRCAIAPSGGKQTRLVNVSGVRGRVLRTLIKCSQRRDHFSFAQRANTVGSANHPAAARQSPDQARGEGSLPVRHSLSLGSVSFRAFGDVGSSRPAVPRSPLPSQIKGENTPLASRTPSRRAGIRLRPTRPQLPRLDKAMSDRQRALPVRDPRPLMLKRIRHLPDQAHPMSGTPRSPSQRPSHAAFLGWRARTFAGRVSLSEPFFAFVTGTDFVYSSKLGQIVAKPQWMQSGFWE
jgi:hypothetical protein